MIVWRTVLAVNRYKVPSGTRYHFMLATCLHTVRCKGSDGIPKRKRCHQCEMLAGGSIVRVVTGHGVMVESWDAENNKPRKETEAERAYRLANEGGDAKT